MLVGPQQRAVGIVDQPVAVRADDRHVAGSFDQRLLQILPFSLVMRGLAKTGREADGAAGTGRAQFAHHVDGEVAIDADEGSIRRVRQLRERTIGLDPGDLVLCRVDRPDFAGKAHLQRLLDDVGRKEAAADNRDGFRTQQTGKVADTRQCHGFAITEMLSAPDAAARRFSSSDRYSDVAVTPFGLSA